MPSNENRSRFSGRWRRIWPTLAVLATLAAGTIPASPATALAATGTTSPSTQVGTCIVDGLDMGICPTGSMTASPNPPLVSTATQFKVSVSSMTSSPLPNSAWAVDGSGHHTAKVTFSCNPGCGRYSIQWTHPGGSALIVEFNNTSPAASVPSSASCGYYWHSGPSNYTPTDPCVATDNPACFAPSSCRIPHIFPADKTYYPLLIANWNAILPYVAGPMGGSSTIGYQNLQTNNGTYPQLSGPDVWHSDTAYNYNVGFTQHYVTDSYNSYTTAGAAHSASTIRQFGTDQVQSVCHGCGPPEAKTGGPCSEDCTITTSSTRICDRSDGGWAVGEASEGNKAYGDSYGNYSGNGNPLGCYNSQTMTVRQWVSSGYWQNYRAWVDTGHWQYYRAWVDTGHWQYYRYWVDTSHWDYYRYWVDTSHWDYYRYWVDTSHWDYYSYWVDTSHSESYRYWVDTSHWKCRWWGCWWVSSGHYATGSRWVSSGHWATGRRWVSSGHYDTGRRWVSSGHYATGRRWVSSGHYATGRRWVSGGYWTTKKRWVSSGYWTTKKRWVDTGHWVNKKITRTDTDDQRTATTTHRTQSNVKTNTLNPGHSVPVYTTRRVPDYYSRITATYDNQALNSYGSSYSALSVCRGCGGAFSQYSTHSAGYSYRVPVGKTYTLQPGEVSAANSSCPDSANLSDLADWNGFRFGGGLKSGCDPTFYPNTVTVVGTVPQSYTTNTLVPHSVTSYSPSSRTYSYQYLTPHTGTYTSRWLTGGTWTVAGYSKSTKYAATSCNRTSTSGDADGQDGDGKGVLYYFDSCNYGYLPINTNPSYFVSYSVGGTSHPYTSYTVNTTSTSINQASASTVNYDTVGSTSGSYRALSRSVKATPFQISLAGSGEQLQIKPVQAQGGLA